MPEFDLHAKLEPAREVGGDLFDFFFLDDEHLCFNVGDVSGKGVPASLFMAIAKTLIKTRATELHKRVGRHPLTWIAETLIKTRAPEGMTPEIILNQVNEDLSADNPSLLFVTLFLGTLNIKDGILEYCNGGHNPPYIIRATGEIEALEMTGGIALGVSEDFRFQSKRITLDKGDTVFIYSDGVTEAMNSRHELFSEERLEAELDRLKGLPVADIIAAIMEKIHEFSEDEPQADDITLLIIRYNGS
jgi:sigma-B regulation protein RsbU (phosphoserine phosphatase)